MTGTPTKTELTERISHFEKRKETIRRACEGMLLEARNAGREYMTVPEQQRYDAMLFDLSTADAEIAEARTDLDRIPDRLPGNLGYWDDDRRGRGGHQVSSAGQLAPLAFTDEALRRAHARIGGGETAVLETRDFVTAIDHLPAQLYSPPTFPRHDNRVLDRLAGIQIDAPSLEFIQVNTITGSAAIVGEGQVKPEVKMPATKQIIPALKLACHAGVSWENVSDYDTFVQAVRNELMAQVIDLENKELVYGDPASGGLNGMLKTPGILSYPAGGDTSFDDIAGAIAALRTGPALAVPNLLLLHPDSWAAIRTEKNLQGSYYVSSDPSTDQVEQVWGVPVLQSTAFTPGEGVLLDTQLMGKVAIRESMVLRVGFSGDDFVRNIVRSIAEERLNLAVERPAAICRITGLPTATVVETKSSSKAKSS